MRETERGWGKNERERKRIKGGNKKKKEVMRKLERE